MKASRSLALVAAAGLLAAGGANADDPGGDAISSPTTPALVAIRRADPRSEVALSVGGTVVHDAARSGLARGALELQGSWAPSPRWEIFATLNAMAFRWLQVPGGTNGAFTLGSMTVGTTWIPVSLPGGRLDAGPFLRFLLPTSLELPDVHVWGAQAGLTFRGVATGWLAWFGGVSLPVTRAYGKVTGTRTDASATLGLAFVPASWVRVVAQVSGFVPFGRGNDQVAPGLGVRFVDGPFGAELGALLPLGGSTRPFSTVARVSWRL
jgi:hypothetical protein